MRKQQFPTLYVLGAAMAMAVPMFALAQPQEVAHSATVGTTAHEMARDEHTITATVVSVDPSTRMVTLRGPNGKEETIQAGPDVQDLDQVKPGDQVTAHYQAAVALELLPADSAQAGTEYTSGSANAPQNDLPGVVRGQSVSVTSKLTAVDLKHNTVTLTGADGKARVIEVKDPARQARLKTLKVGEMVRITYVEALAVTVTPKPKAKPKS